MGLTQELCERIVALRDVRDHRALAAAKTLAIDGFAVALAGVAEERPPHILAAHLREMGGVPTASAFGFDWRTNPVSAAYLNGVSMHVLDFEAMWYPPTHPTSTTLPAAAALAEHLGASGGDLLLALLKGTEMQGRILLAVKNYSVRDLAFHPPGIAGVMGAAVAGAHLLGLDVAALRNALGLAASRACALIANVGTMTKSTHCGLAASLGLEAAMLAAHGFTANADILDRGYFEAFFKNEVDSEALLAFGEPFRLVEPGVAIKMFPSQYGTHFGITAGLALHPQFDLETLEVVEFTVPPMHYVDRPLPATGLDGKFSLQYTLAAALLDGAVTIGTFADERRFRADMRELLPKIHLIIDESIAPEFMRMHVKVRIVARDGSRVEHTCDGPLGLWNRTPIHADDHAHKVDDCLATALDTPARDRLRELLANLEQRGPAAVAECFSLLRTVPKRIAREASAERA